MLADLPYYDYNTEEEKSSKDEYLDKLYERPEDLKNYIEKLNNS